MTTHVALDPDDVSPDSNSSCDSIPPLYFMCVVWGPEFIDMFVRYTIASLLSPNNLPALSDKIGARFLICTTPADWAALSHYPLYREMCRHISPIFLDISDRYFQFKYHKMGFGHKRLTSAAFSARAVGINVNPDTIIPDGAVAEVERLLLAGKNLILCQAVRFNQDGVLADLTANGRIHPNKSITLTMREAAYIGIRNFHPETLAGNWDALNFGQLHEQHGKDHFPICCYFTIPGENGVVIFGHNWAPFAINYASLDVHHTKSLDHWTIDGVYAFENFATQEVGRQVHIVTDSDSLFLLGMTPHAEMAFEPDPRWWKGSGWLCEWSKGYLLNRVLYCEWMDDLRRAIYPNFARWHDADLSDRWYTTEARAIRIIGSYCTNDLSLSAVTSRAASQGFRGWLGLVLSGLVLKLVWWSVFLGSHPDRRGTQSRLSCCINSLLLHRHAYYEIARRAMLGNKEAASSILHSVPVATRILRKEFCHTFSNLQRRIRRWLFDHLF